MGAGNGELGQQPRREMLLWQPLSQASPSLAPRQPGSRRDILDASSSRSVGTPAFTLLLPPLSQRPGKRSEAWPMQAETGAAGDAPCLSAAFQTRILVSAVQIASIECPGCTLSLDSTIADCPAQAEPDPAGAPVHLSFPAASIECLTVDHLCTIHALTPFELKSSRRPSLVLLAPLGAFLLASTFIAVYWPARVEPDLGRGSMDGAGAAASTSMRNQP